MPFFQYPENILPLPSFSYNGGISNSVVRSTMETGRPRQRRRFTAEFERAAVTFEFNNDQFAAFRAVWKHRLNNGNDWFEMRLPVGLRENLTLSQVRFISPFSYQYLGGNNWNVSTEIELYTSAVILDDELSMLIEYGYDLEATLDGLEATHDQLHPIIHEDIPNN